MGRFFFGIGQRILISNRHQSVRKGFIFFITNLMLFVAIVFAVEIALILLGMGNIFIPWTRQALNLLNSWLF